MPRERSLTEVLRAHKDALKDDIRKVLPATVTAVNPTKQTVDVKLAVQNPVFDELGRPTFEDLPGLSDVPLGVMRGGGFFVWVPVSVGDSVLVLFSDLSMDSWRQAAGSGTSEPVWLGKHTADSPIAIPCIAPDKDFLVDPLLNASKLVIGKDGTQAQIKLSATDISLGATGGDNIALAAKLDDLINTLLAGYTPAGPETGFGAFMTALATWKTANWTGPSATVKSTLIKAQ